MKDVIDCWNEKASQWRTLVGDKGDSNRIFNSDPVLWNFLGEITGKTILDAGCGTGYLSVQMSEKLATVIGVDVSEKMIKEAKKFGKEKNAQIDFRVDSCSKLSSVPSQSIDKIVCNYVLMDLPDLSGALQNFHRVLKPSGLAVCIFTHPCFTELSESEMYFDEIKKKDRWGRFTSDFIYFHRPLSTYWREFKRAGFQIENFDEPIAQDPFAPGFQDLWRKNYRKQAWSVAFRLIK